MDEHKNKERQPLGENGVNTDEGITVHSYCLRPEFHQPSGTVDLGLADPWQTEIMMARISRSSAPKSKRRG